MVKNAKLGREICIYLKIDLVESKFFAPTIISLPEISVNMESQSVALIFRSGLRMKLCLGWMNREEPPPVQP